jgi:predicted DNA-binding protein
MELISTKLPAPLRRKLAAEAKRRNVTQSTIVRESIERALADVEGTGAPESCLALVADLAGSVRSGRSDLATNKALLQDAMLGRRARGAKRRR